MKRLVYIIAFFNCMACGSGNDSESAYKDSTTDTAGKSTAEENKAGFEASDENFDLLIKEYEDPQRGNWQNPELILQQLGPLDDKVVADLGAGTGYFTIRLVSQVQKVIAIDIDERFLEYIKDRKTELPPALAERIETRLATPDNPALREAEAEVVLIVNTYPFLQNRPLYFSKVLKGMARGGTLLVVDFKKGNFPVGPDESFKVQRSTVKEELVIAGFENVEVDSTSLQYQYMVTATRPGALP